MKYYLLHYYKVADYAARQAPHALAHRDHIARCPDLLLGGNLGEAEALVLFRCASSDPVAQFAADDPYVIHGIVERWTVQEWDVAVGSLFSVSSS